MLYRSQIPANQLKSVAERYAGSLARADLRRMIGRGGSGMACAAQEAAQRRSIAESNESYQAIEANESLQRLEAVLFLAREPLTSRRLSQYANLADGTQARTLVRRLNERYDAAGRAFRVEHVAGGYQLLTRRKFAPWLRRLEHVPAETRLSAPALETLAVIAYRQPVLRADIEAVRGVNCGEILRQLMERELVRIDGRSEELGRPYLYSTTKRFLQIFGLVHLDELPGNQELRHGPPGPAPPVIPFGPHEPAAEPISETTSDESQNESIES